MRVDRNWIWLVLCLSLLCIFSVIVRSHAQPPSPAPATTTVSLAEQQYKNIQVFKGVPADQIIPAMQFMSASLGVDCNYCHVEGARDKDDKKAKLTARKMISMMMAINKQHFDGEREVTCYSCHHGVTNPVSTPIITGESSNAHDGEEHSEKEKAPLPSAAQILDNYLAAVGGAGALHKITSRIEHGTLSGFGGQPVSVDVFAKAPDKRVSISHFSGSDSFTAFDGQQGWLTVPGRVRVMNASENAAARIDADFYFPDHVRTLYQKFDLELGPNLDGRETFLVIAHNEGQPPLQLYFDRQSGLLVRLVRFAESPLGRNPTQIDYSGYRAADGVTIPFRWTLSRPGTSFTIQVDHLEQNVPINDAQFVPPPPRAESGHQLSPHQ
jgi:photosynthetic reaction center cytochrome c subunit